MALCGNDTQYREYGARRGAAVQVFVVASLVLALVPVGDAASEEGGGELAHSGSFRGSGWCRHGVSVARRLFDGHGVRDRERPGLP